MHPSITPLVSCLLITIFSSPQTLKKTTQTSALDPITESSGLSVCHANKPLRFKELRRALVIGNASYPSGAAFGQLASPVNDAKDIAASLCDLGFEVIYGLNLDRDGMLNALKKFEDNNLDRPVQDLRLFYYSGHGAQVLERNYLIPIRESFQDADTIRAKGIDLDTVYKALTRNHNNASRFGNQNNIVIVDACRSNELSTRLDKTRISLGLALPIRAPLGTLIAFATAPGSRAVDQDPEESGSRRNSIYTRSLLNHIKEPGLPIPNLFNEVRHDVAKQSVGVQIPWENVSTLRSTSFAPPVDLQWKVEAVDDLVAIYINNYPVLQETAPTTWIRTPPHILHTGTNAFEVFVYNDKTKRHGNPWEEREGWKYKLALRVNGVDVPCHGQRNEACEGGEKSPGPEHWGRLFSVLKGDIVVDAHSSEVEVSSGLASSSGSMINAHPVPVPPDAFKSDLIWSIHDTGFVESQIAAEWQRLGISDCLSQDGRVCAMRLAVQEAKRGNDQRAFEIAVSTQLHNPEAAERLTHAGPVLVAKFLRSQ
jgi:hypothetical protein